MAFTDGRSVEVINLRTLSPLDMDTIAASVAKTGRCVVVHEAPVFGGIGGEIAARVTEACFYHLEAPVLRVGGFATPYPPSRIEEHYLPDLDKMMAGGPGAGEVVTAHRRCRRCPPRRGVRR